MQRVLICPFGDVNLLITLGEKLREAELYDVTYVCFTLYEREIYRAHQLPHIYIAPGEAARGLSDERLTTALRHTLALANRHGVSQHETQFVRTAHYYAEQLTDYLVQGGYEDVILFNGQHNLFVAVLNQVVEELGLRKLVFEQGLFRPHYITIDGKGVNACNSVQALDELLSPEAYDYQESPLYQDILDLLPLASGEPRDYKRGVAKLRMLGAYLQTKVQPRWRIFLRSAENRDLLEDACFPAQHAMPRTQILDQLLASDDYEYVILCPLQVTSDTQISSHSPLIQHMPALVDIVERAVEDFNRSSPRKACVIFKVHPMEAQPLTVRTRDAFLVNESSVAAILDTRCDLVITINSTAGIEAIERQIPVITLGNAFYSFPGVVHSHCDELPHLAEQVASGLTSPAHDPGLQQRFIDALRDKYQVALRPLPDALLYRPTASVRESSPVGG